MNYLKSYNINDEQINDIINVLVDNHVNVDLFKFDSEKIISILDLFKSIGVNNFYELIITAPAMFCDTYTSIVKRIESYGNKEELGQLINEDMSNLHLVDLI